MKIFDSKNTLSFGLVYGCGPKFVGIAIFDELIAVISIIDRLIKKKLNFSSFYRIEKLLSLYFLFLAFIGLLYTQNINCMRFIAIGFFLLFYNSNTTYNISSLIFGARLFLISYFSIVFSCFFFNLEVAFWQDSLWTGTAYAAVFSLFSAWICIVFGKNIIDALITCILFFSTAVLADSRLQILISFALIPALIVRFQEHNNLKNKYIKNICSIVLFVGISIVFFNTMKNIETNLLQTVAETFDELIIKNDKDRDYDRKDSIHASLSWAGDNPIKLITGSGILAHQIELRKYYPGSRDGSGKVRPVGISAMIVDGGMILILLIMFNTIKTYLCIIQIKAPVLLKLSAILILILVLLSIFVTNLCDAILFWLIIMPSGILPFVLRVWVSRFPRSVSQGVN